MNKIMYLIKKLRKKIEIKNRRKYWHNDFLKNTTNPNLLSDEQKKEIDVFWQRFNIKPDYIFYNFYLEKTGMFDINYIPDDIYYCYIDSFYNNWEYAKHVDNKCDYNLLFNGINIPETIIKRQNNIYIYIYMTAK